MDKLSDKTLLFNYLDLADLLASENPNQSSAIDDAFRAHEDEILARMGRGRMSWVGRIWKAVVG